MTEGHYIDEYGTQLPQSVVDAGSARATISGIIAAALREYERLGYRLGRDDEAEKIVRTLAASESVEDVGYSGEISRCVLCRVDSADELGIDNHEPTCPWRLAVEWVARRGQP